MRYTHTIKFSFTDINYIINYLENFESNFYNIKEIPNLVLAQHYLLFKDAYYSSNGKLFTISYNPPANSGELAYNTETFFTSENLNQFKALLAIKQLQEK